MTIADVGEFGLISRVTRRLPAGPATLLGPGDDAAVVAAPDGRVVATTDVLVDGRHFRRDGFSDRRGIAVTSLAMNNNLQLVRSKRLLQRARQRVWRDNHAQSWMLNRKWCRS